MRDDQHRDRVADFGGAAFLHHLLDADPRIAEAAGDLAEYAGTVLDVEAQVEARLDLRDGRERSIGGGSFGLEAMLRNGPVVIAFTRRGARTPDATMGLVVNAGVTRFDATRLAETRLNRRATYTVAALGTGASPTGDVPKAVLRGARR
mgnify:CR=1 FL=1